MDFGILLPFRNPVQWHAPITKIYDEHIEEAVLAEELGYDHVWTTEHHFYDDAWSPSLLPILAAIAQRTSRIRLGTFIIILPFHHPVRVAEDAATVDILSKGRLDLGLGQGYVVSEFESFRIPRRDVDPCTTCNSIFREAEQWTLVFSCHSGILPNGMRRLQKFTMNI